MTHVGNAPSTLEEKVYKMYKICETKKDLPIKKECSGTQTVNIILERSSSPDSENKENQTNGEVSFVFDQFLTVISE